MRTQVQVDLARLAANYRAVRRLAGDGVAVSAVVKANGYGHGAVPVARVLAQAGARHFSVACIGEGLQLREAAVEGEVLLLSGFLPGEEPDLVAADLTPMLHTRELIDLWRSHARSLDRVLPCHVMINTGMNREGVTLKEPGEIVQMIEAAKELEIRGIATHLASAENLNDAATARQEESFQAVVAQLRQTGLSVPFLHMANSAAIVLRPSARLTMVRPGLMLYGYPPRADGDRSAETPCAPILEWTARVVDIRTVEEGEQIGYGGDYCARSTRRVALVSAGYGDGFRRDLSDNGHVLIRGERRPIVGRISMDLTTVDVTDDPIVAVGDEAVLLGGAVDAREIAERCRTIPYEILCGISPRVPRVYGGTDALASRDA